MKTNRDLTVYYIPMALYCMPQEYEFILLLQRDKNIKKWELDTNISISSRKDRGRSDKNHKHYFSFAQYNCNCIWLAMLNYGSSSIVSHLHTPDVLAFMHQILNPSMIM